MLINEAREIMGKTVRVNFGVVVVNEGAETLENGSKAILGLTLAKSMSF